MAYGGLDDTRKVSFDDVLNERVAVGDESSVEGLVTVPEEMEVEMQSQPLLLLPDMEGIQWIHTPDLYSEFDPPQNPETMRRHKKYATITPTPDYSKIYRHYNWRRVSFETTSSRKPCDEAGLDMDHACTHGGFRHLLSRFASSMQRSQDSRSNILRHRSSISKAVELRKSVDEYLKNETRSRVLDMVMQELGYHRVRCHRNGETGSEGSADEH